MTRTMTLLYAIPAGETERYMEALLLSDATAEQIERVKVLAAKDGFHSFRTATHTDGDMPDFAACVRR